jgi:HPt (histidine-containing phosphotransfer) domain-containing protein
VRPEELAAALSLARALGDDGRPVAEAEVRLEESALESLRELGGDEFLGEVVSTFLEDAPSLLASLRSELEQGDAAELRRAAHTLKTNGLTFGAVAFAELCLELEQRAKTGDLDRAGSLVDRIDQEYVALEQALTLLVPEPAS